MTKKMAAGGSASSFRDMTAGSGSGLGRIQKTSIASKTKAQKLKAGGMADGGLSKADVLAMTGKYEAPTDDNGRRDAAMKAYQARQDKREMEAAAAKRKANARKAMSVSRDAGGLRARGNPDNAGSLGPYGGPNDLGGRPWDYYQAAEGRPTPKPANYTDASAMGNMLPPIVENDEKVRNSDSPLEYFSRKHELEGMRRGGKAKMAKGGKAEAFEGTAKDMAQDKKLAKKRGMSLKDWEKSSEDTKHDTQQNMKGLKMGGKAKMARGGMSTAQDGMKSALRPKPTAMAKGGKAMAHEKGCKCMACGGMAKYAKGGKVTFGSMKPLPGTKTKSFNMMPELAPGTSTKPAGSKGGLRAKASGAKSSSMMKPLGMTKMAKGGKVRGAGIAQRGTKFIGEV